MPVFKTLVHWTQHASIPRKTYAGSRKAILLAVAAELVSSENINIFSVCIFFFFFSLIVLSKIIDSASLIISRSRDKYNAGQLSGFNPNYFDLSPQRSQIWRIGNYTSPTLFPPFEINLGYFREGGEVYGCVWVLGMIGPCQHG